MDKHFEILFLDEAFEFLSSLERKHYEKILYNIRKSQVELDPELFKKLSNFASFQTFRHQSFDTLSKFEALSVWIPRHLLQTLKVWDFEV